MDIEINHIKDTDFWTANRISDSAQFAYVVNDDAEALWEKIIENQNYPQYPKLQPDQKHWFDEIIHKVIL